MAVELQEDLDYSSWFKNAYEGASVSNIIGDKGLVYGNNNQLNARELIYLQLRCLHLIRNNPYAATGFNKLAQSMGFLKIRWQYGKGKRKGDSHKDMQDLWDEFCNNPCVDNIGNFNTIHDGWNKSLLIYGSSHTRMRIKVTGNKNKIPLKLEPISAELHDVGLVDNYENVFHGIRFISDIPSHFYYHQDVYKNAFKPAIASLNKHTIISANEILYGFQRNFPGQLIGVPTFAPIILYLYDLDELVDATIAKQKTAQVFGIVVKNTNPAAPVAFGNTLVSLNPQTGKKEIKFKNTGGNVLYLNSNEEADFFQVEDIGPNLQILIDSEVAKIASCLSLPYHELSGNTSHLNLAIIKHLAQTLRLRMEYLHTIVTIPMILQPLANYFQQLASLKGKKFENAIPIFQMPRYYGSDALKDAQADVLEIRNGLNTYARALQERDLTPEEIEKDRQVIAELHLTGLLDKLDGKSEGQIDNVEPNSNTRGNEL